MAYLVLEGQINLTKNRKVKHVVRAGEILGLAELLAHDSIPFSAEVMPKTKVLFIDRSTVKEILSERDDQLKRSFASILETA